MLAFGRHKRSTLRRRRVRRVVLLTLMLLLTLILTFLPLLLLTLVLFLTLLIALTLLSTLTLSLALAISPADPQLMFSAAVVWATSTYLDRWVCRFHVWRICLHRSTETSSLRATFYLNQEDAAQNYAAQKRKGDRESQSLHRKTGGMRGRDDRLQEISIHLCVFQSS